MHVEGQDGDGTLIEGEEDDSLKPVVASSTALGRTVFAPKHSLIISSLSSTDCVPASSWAVNLISKLVYDCVAQAFARSPGLGPRCSPPSSMRLGWPSLPDTFSLSCSLRSMSLVC